MEKFIAQSLTENTVYIFSPWKTNSLFLPEHKWQHGSTRCRCCKIANVHGENVPRKAIFISREASDVAYHLCSAVLQCLDCAPGNCQDSFLKVSMLNFDSVNRNKVFLFFAVFLQGLSVKPGGWAAIWILQKRVESFTYLHNSLSNPTSMINFCILYAGVHKKAPSFLFFVHYNSTQYLKNERRRTNQN